MLRISVYRPGLPRLLLFALLFTAVSSSRSARAQTVESFTVSRASVPSGEFFEVITNLDHEGRRLLGSQVVVFDHQTEVIDVLASDHYDETTQPQGFPMTGSGDERQEVREEGEELLVRLRGGGMIGAVRHRDPVLVAEEAVHSAGVVQRLPALRWIFRTPGDEERSRSHQGVQFHEVSFCL